MDEGFDEDLDSDNREVFSHDVDDMTIVPLPDDEGEEDTQEVDGILLPV